MTTNEQKMCGFVGLFDIRQKSDALRTQVLKMSKNIRHRGPDWSGVYCGERAILSHERLSIVDPQSGGQPLFSRDGKLVLAVNGDGTLLLQAGKMKMTVKAGQVRLLETAEEIEEKKKQAARSRAANGGGTVQINTGARASAELDIRGLETLEAESVVENYLDAAQRSKLGSVTIIHGKGTGALRAAVHQLLKRSKQVKSFRLGRYGEGEAGVTVVELK